MGAVIFSLPTEQLLGPYLWDPTSLHMCTHTAHTHCLVPKALYTQAPLLPYKHILYTQTHTTSQHTHSPVNTKHLNTHTHTTLDTDTLDKDTRDTDTLNTDTDHHHHHLPPCPASPADSQPLDRLLSSLLWHPRYPSSSVSALLNIL